VPEWPWSQASRSREAASPDGGGSKLGLYNPESSPLAPLSPSSTHLPSVRGTRAAFLPPPQLTTRPNRLVRLDASGGLDSCAAPD
jgi:hypothetical protein